MKKYLLLLFLLFPVQANATWYDMEFFGGAFMRTISSNIYGLLNDQGKLASLEYCDEAGLHCTDIADVLTGIAGSETAFDGWDKSTSDDVTELSDLSDVGTTTPTNRNVLVADGDSWEARSLTEADISDLTHTVDTTCDGETCNIANTGTLDGYEASELLDNTDDQTLSLVTNTLSIENGNSVDLSGYYSASGGTISGNVSISSNNNLTVDTNTFFVDGIGNNVGIGTTSPTNKLDVSGAQVIGSSYAGIATAPSNGLLVEGNVGIGTNSPDAKLTIQGTTATDLPTYSDELLTVGGWTVGSNWTEVPTGTFTHTTGNTGTLTHNATITSGYRYQVSWTITGRTAGSVNITIGGQSSGTQTGSSSFGPTTTSTASLTITPTSDFNGTISAISLKQITGISSPVFTLKDSSGTTRFEARTSSANYNTFLGMESGKYNTTGGSNTANGYRSLYSNTTGYNNTANGYYSLSSNTTGTNNTANGVYSLSSNTTGTYNTANGVYSLQSNTTGTNNTANGVYSLHSNTTGTYNTANGVYSLQSNTTGTNNTANGVYSLHSNTTGTYNTANGTYSLQSNTTGTNNTANGYRSLQSNTTGTYNTANGVYSLSSNTTGTYNTANGTYSLSSNTTGSNNTANGYYSLQSNTTGSKNVALGRESGRFQADGTTALTDPENSVYIGYNAKGYSNADSNSIVIGYNAVGIGANTAVLGNDSITTTALKGNVGIGTTAPTNKLDVSGGQVIGSSYAGIETAPTNGLLVQGNVGIGTTSPSAKLHVDGIAIFDTDSDAQKVYITRSGAVGEHVAMSVNDSDFTIESRQDEPTGTYGNMIIKMGGKVADGQTPYFAVRNWTETGNVTTDLFKVEGTKQYLIGNVGIGTTSPTEPLDVNGSTIRIRSSKTVSTSSTTCDAGEIAWSTSYIYVCTATNTWKRVALSSF